MSTPVRSIVISRPGEVEQQIDFNGSVKPDGIMLVLEDGSIICYGDRDGYGPASVWVMDPDGADVAEITTVATDKLTDAVLADRAPRNGIEQYQAEDR